MLMYTYGTKNAIEKLTLPHKPPKTVADCSTHHWQAFHHERNLYNPDDVHIRWFEDGELNVVGTGRSSSPSTRHPSASWPRTTVRKPNITTRCSTTRSRTPNALSAGLRVAMEYDDMPMVPRLSFDARMRATWVVHSVSLDFPAIADRIRLEATDDHLEPRTRGGKDPTKVNIDRAREDEPSRSNVVVHRRIETQVEWNAERDRWYHDLVSTEEASCPWNIQC